MSDSQITLVFGVLAILGTAVLLFRQGALGIKSIVTIFTVTIGLGGFLFYTLIDVAN